MPSLHSDCLARGEDTSSPLKHKNSWAGGKAGEQAKMSFTKWIFKNRQLNSGYYTPSVSYSGFLWISAHGA